jgi:O-methyltransferase
MLPLAPLQHSLALASRAECESKAATSSKNCHPEPTPFIMKHILHDWDDDSATRILQACHRALGLRGKLLIVDPVVPPGNAPHYGKLLDLEMLVLTPRGRERTKAEFTSLLRGAGFRLSRIVATHSPLSIVEAVKA